MSAVGDNTPLLDGGGEKDQGEQNPDNGGQEEQGKPDNQKDKKERTCLQKIMFIMEVLVMFVFLFYMDIGLDLMSIVSMWNHHCRNLATVNILGVLAANVLGIVSILQSRAGSLGKDTDRNRMILFGLYYPFQLHVLYLGYVSIREMSLHPFLTHIKTEGNFEAYVAVNVQAYFVVFSELEPRKRLQLLLSILSSALNLAFSYASFDVKKKGFDSVVGTASYKSFLFLQVLVFRVCEVVARVSSLALFNLACRPFGALIEVSIEGFVWVFAIHLCGGRKFYAGTSIFSYMNPILERGNAGSVPCHVYYLVRSASMLAMLATAALWRGQELRVLFQDDPDFLAALAAGCSGMAVLLPVLRWQAKDSLLSLEQYPSERWVEKAFSDGERKLLHDLRASFAAEGHGAQMRKQCLAPLESEMDSLEQLLGSAREQEIARPDLKIGVERFMTAVFNCPLRDAPLEVQGRACRLLERLSEGVSLAPDKMDVENFDEEVVSVGGLELAAELCQALVDVPPGSPCCSKDHPLEEKVAKSTGCEMCQQVIPDGDTIRSCPPCHYDLCLACFGQASYKGHNDVLCPAMGLAALSCERKIVEESTVGSLAQIVQRLFDSEVTIDMDTAVQMVGVLLDSSSTSLAELVAKELSGGDQAPAPRRSPSMMELPARETSVEAAPARPKLLAAAVAHSLREDKLEPRLLLDILQQHPEHPFVWRQVEDRTAECMPKNRAPSAYVTLGGLCVHALLEQRRGGSKGTEDMPSSANVEEWRWQLRSPEEFFADLRDEIERKGPRGNYTAEEYEADWTEQGRSRWMKREFERRWADKRHADFAALADAAVSTGCLEALGRFACLDDPEVWALYMITRMLNRVGRFQGSDSAVMAQIATTLAAADFLEALPRLMVYERDNSFGDNARVTATWLCPVEPLKPKMVKVLEMCLKHDPPFPSEDIAWLAGPLCTSDRSARELSQTGLLDCMLPLGMGDEGDALEQHRYNAITAICSLVEKSSLASNSETLARIASSENFMSALVDKLASGWGEPWETIRPPMKLATFEVGRAALIRYGAVKKLRRWVAKELREVNDEGPLSPPRMRALDYAMQTLLLLVSDGKEAVEQVTADGEEGEGAAEAFRALVNGVGKEVPSLLHQAHELRMYLPAQVPSGGPSPAAPSVL